VGKKLEYLFAFTNYYFLTKKDMIFVSSFTTTKKMLPTKINGLQSMQTSSGFLTA
jgi:hypothetical protein